MAKAVISTFLRAGAFNSKLLLRVSRNGRIYFRD
jgi:hypothetical protein